MNVSSGPAPQLTVENWITSMALFILSHYHDIYLWVIHVHCHTLAQEHVQCHIQNQSELSVWETNNFLTHCCRNESASFMYSIMLISHICTCSQETDSSGFSFLFLSRKSKRNSLTQSKRKHAVREFVLAVMTFVESFLELRCVKCLMNYSTLQSDHVTPRQKSNVGQIWHCKIQHLQRTQWFIQRRLLSK